MCCKKIYKYIFNYKAGVVVKMGVGEGEPSFCCSLSEPFVKETHQREEEDYAQELGKKLKREKEIGSYGRDDEIKEDEEIDQQNVLRKINYNKKL